MARRGLAPGLRSTGRSNSHAERRLAHQHRLQEAEAVREVPLVPAGMSVPGGPVDAFGGLVLHSVLELSAELPREHRLEHAVAARGVADLIVRGDEEGLIGVEPERATGGIADDVIAEHARRGAEGTVLLAPAGGRLDRVEPTAARERPVPGIRQARGGGKEQWLELQRVRPAGLQDHIGQRAAAIALETAA